MISPKEIVKRLEVKKQPENVQSAEKAHLSLGNENEPNYDDGLFNSR